MLLDGFGKEFHKSIVVGNDSVMMKRSTTRPGLSLSEREVDLEELARHCSAISTTPGSPPLTHDNVRGAEYFDQGGPTSC